MPTTKSNTQQQALLSKIDNLIALLKESHESVGVAIGVELEYGDYAAAERLRDLRSRIEFEVNNSTKNSHLGDS